MKEYGTIYSLSRVSQKNMCVTNNRANNRIRNREEDGANQKVTQPTQSNNGENVRFNHIYVIADGHLGSGWLPFPAKIIAEIEKTIPQTTTTKKEITIISNC